jgi:hypothetical protein
MSDPSVKTGIFTVSCLRAVTVAGCLSPDNASSVGWAPTVDALDSASGDVQLFIIGKP